MNTSHHITHLTPGQRLNRLHPRNKVQLLQQHLRRSLQIHGVKVQTTDPNVLVYDPPTKLRDQRYTYFAHFLVIILHGLERIEEVLRNDGFGEARCSLEAPPSLDWRNAWYDGAGDTNGTDSFDPVDENLHVVEHLRKDDAAACVYLFLEVLELQVTLMRRKEHVLRETSDTNVEVVPILLVNVPDEVDAMCEPTLYRLPLVSVGWWVASKREDVSATILLCFLYVLAQHTFMNGLSRHDVPSMQCPPSPWACWCMLDACKSLFQLDSDMF